MKKGGKIIKRYAKSLFNSAGIGGAEKVIRELSLFKELIEKNRDMKSVLISPLFEERDRKNTIDLIALRLNLSEISKRFIQKLAEDNLMNGLTEIIRILNNLYLEGAKKSRVTIITPFTPGASAEEKLKKTLKSVFNREVELEHVIDPSLIGGLIVKAGSTMFDFSIQSHLRLLKDRLLRGGHYGN